MNGIKILHTADLHLGSGHTGTANGKIEGENAFLKIINICKSQMVDFLLIAGDLFDTPFADSDLVSRVISAMQQIPETTIAIAPGNHDCACAGSVYLKYDFPKNVVIFSSFLEHIDFPQKNVRLWGAGFTDRFENIPLLQTPVCQSSDLINLCVLHGELAAENSHSSYNPIYPSAIQKSGFDYLALGHIHKRSEIQKLGNTYYSYSGCHCGRGFDEPGELGVYIGEVSKNSLKLEFCEIALRKYIIKDIDITDCKNTFDVSEKVLSLLENHYGNKFSDNLYRITLRGTVAIDTSISINHLTSVLAERLCYIEIADKCDIDIRHMESIATETSLRGIFVSKMLDKISLAQQDEKEKYKNALKIGLRAFSKGVAFHDN